MLSRSRSCSSEVLWLKSLIRRRFQAGARSSAAISAENSATSPMRMSGCGDAVLGGGVEAEREHFGVRRRLVRAAEGFDAGLQELDRRFGVMAEDRTEIAEALRLAGRGRGEVVARDRDGEVGPQAQLVAVRIGREIHALADVLAREVEERLRRLQDRRRDARIARALEQRRAAPSARASGAALVGAIVALVMVRPIGLD